MRGIGTLAGENIFPNKVYLKYSSRIEDSHKGKKKSQAGIQSHSTVNGFSLFAIYSPQRNSHV